MLLEDYCEALNPCKNGTCSANDLYNQDYEFSTYSGSPYTCTCAAGFMGHDCDVGKCNMMLITGVRKYLEEQ
jgi:hypothetical protein